MKNKKTVFTIVILTILTVIGNIVESPELPERQRYVLECENVIKTKLQHPSTYNKDFLRDTVENKKVSIYFSAKNSFGLELKYQGVCIFDDNFMVNDINIQEVH